MANSTTRTKQVTMDGATFIIAPLTLDQIEEYVAPLEELEGKATAKIRVFNLVCNGLNNALLDEDGNFPEGVKPWTQEKMRKRIDMVLYERLQSEILAFSGFKLEDAEALAVPGESNAASAKGSSQPVAESSQPSTSATSVAAS